MLLLLFGFVLSQEIWLTLYIVGTKLNIVLLTLIACLFLFYLTLRWFSLYIFKYLVYCYVTALLHRCRVWVEHSTWCLLYFSNSSLCFSLSLVTLNCLVYLCPFCLNGVCCLELDIHSIDWQSWEGRIKDC